MSKKLKVQNYIACIVVFLTLFISSFRMFEFTLPGHGDKIFSAHENSVFHTLGQYYPDNSTEDEQKAYFDRVYTFIRESDTILPGDIVHTTCYYYPSRPSYGLAIIYIGKDGKKHWDYFGDGGMNDIEGADLYAICLNKNPAFFRNACRDIFIFNNCSDYLFRKSGYQVSEEQLKTVESFARSLIARAKK